MEYSVFYPATWEPVTLLEAKRHLRVTTDDDDAEIFSLIVAAREFVETRTRRIVTTQVIDFYLDDFLDEMEIPFAPLINSIISPVTIKYLDTNNVEQTLASTCYEVDTAAEPGVIRIGYNQVWPYTRGYPKSVTIHATVGYLSSDLVPMAAKQAILLKVGDLYENREGIIVGTISEELPVLTILLNSITVARTE